MFTNVPIIYMEVRNMNKQKNVDVELYKYKHHNVHHTIRHNMLAIL